MIQAALVGCAHIHTPGFIKRLLARRSSVNIRRVWDPNRARGRKRAAELSTQAVSNVDAIWNDPEITAVVITSETDRHLELVTAAAAAGKHMFVEKPLGLGAADAAKMARAIEKARVTFQTGYFMRGQPINRFLREQVERGAFGKITRVRATNCHAGALEDWFSPEWKWMTERKHSGCGAFGDLGTHVLDIMMWMLGDVDSVAAATASPLKKYGAQCDETGEGLLRFRSGTLGSLAAGWVDVANPVTLVISGTHGIAWVADGKLFFKSKKVRGAEGKEPWTSLPEALPHAFELFFDALEGKDVPLVSPAEAAGRSAVVEAFYEAAASGKWTRVPSTGTR
jgi:predicted dehydrogenase